MVTVIVYQVSWIKDGSRIVTGIIFTQISNKVLVRLSVQILQLCDKRMSKVGVFTLLTIIYQSNHFIHRVSANTEMYMAT